MRKALGFAIAALFAFPPFASAEDAVGTIRTIDRAEHALVLEDGTRLFLEEGMLLHLREGEKVQAVYTTQGGKNLVTELEVRTIVDGTETTDVGGAASSPFTDRSIQTSD